MEYAHDEVRRVADVLIARIEELENPKDILKAPELGSLYGQLRSLPADQKASFGADTNQLKQQLEAKVDEYAKAHEQVQPLDVTAPLDVNSAAPSLLSSAYGNRHPLTKEIDIIVDIFSRMGF